MKAELPNSAFKNLLNRDWKGGDEAADYKVRESRRQFTYFIFANF